MCMLNSLHVTGDGASLTNELGHITVGYKLVDKRAKNSDNSAINYQSYYSCFPIRTVIAEENKYSMERVFRSIYEFTKKISQEGFENSKPFIVSAPHDGKALNMLLGRGGGAKIMEHFCPYCCMTSDQILTKRHWDLMDHIVVEKAKQHVETLMQADFYKEFFSELDSKQKKKKKRESDETDDDEGLIIREAPRKNEIVNHIDFDWEGCNNPRHLYYFKDKLKCEINRKQKLGALMDVNVDEEQIGTMVAALKCQIREEEEAAISYNILQLDQLSIEQDRFIDPEQSIFDILHLENRTIERIVMILLRDGATGKVLKTYQKDVENVVNSNDFRNTERSNRKQYSSWKFPTGEEGDVIGEVKFSGKRAKKFLKKLHLLYDVCLGPPTGNPARDKFASAIDEYRRIINLLESKDDLDSDQLQSLDVSIENFATLWEAVSGRDGYTNYFHHLTSGHVSYFARKYKNFYRFSQQGWEAQNSRIKNTFWHRIQRAGRGAKEPTYLMPIYKYFQRSFAWRTGLGDIFFDGKIGANNDNDPALQAYAILHQLNLN